MRHECTHGCEVRCHREGSLISVPRREVWWRFGSIDHNGVDPAAQVAVDLPHEVSRREAIRLPVLGHNITDVDNLAFTRANRLSDPIDEEAGHQAGVEISGANE